MANCVQCGKPLSSFSLGELADCCPECRQQVAPASQPHPQPVAPKITLSLALSLFPATTTLIAINVAVFLAMTLSGVSFTFPSSPDLLKWQADFGPLTLTTQPWRALTSNYVHIGILHILLNMWCLWNLGFLAERIFGRVTFLFVYTLTGIAGSVASLWWRPEIVSAGASGAIFGIAGALITALYLGKLPYSREALRPTLKSVVSFAVYNLFIGAATGFVNNAAHIGGLVMGLALGAVLGRVLTAEPDRRKPAETFLFLAAALLLCVSFWQIRKSNANLVAEYSAQEALQNKSPDAAIQKLEPLTKANPNNLRALTTLGHAYLLKKDYANAEAVLNQVLARAPNDPAAKFYLGLAYLATKRWASAQPMFADLTQKFPKNVSSWIFLGESLNGLNRPQEAIDAYRRALDLDSKDSDAYRGLGAAQLKIGQTDAAIQSMRKAVELSPNSALAQRGLGAAYLAAGRQQDATAAFQKSDQLQSSGKSSDDE